MARTSNLANVATVSRATKAWYPGGWDFTNGGAITGDLVEYANNVARDGAQGLLVEESSTNEIRNPRAEGAVAGTPGTAPTNWQVAPTALQQVVGSGTENGWPYVDIRLNGTPTFDPAITPEADTQITASDGQTWTGSMGVKLVGGDLTNVNGVALVVLGRTAAGGTDGGTFNQSASITPDGTHKRLHLTATLDGGASTERVITRLIVDWDGSGAIDITLRIYAPQLEEKAYPTSPILPPASSPAASDRDADNITLDLGAWFTDDAFSFYASFTPNQVSNTSQVIFGFSDGAFTDTVYIVTETSGTITTAVRAGGSPLFSGNNFPSAAVAATQSRVAVGIESDNFASSCNGQTQKTDTSGTVGQLTTRATIGNSPWSTGASSGTLYIEEIRYWPRRLTNSELEALVGN